jgi:phosphohistidine phosphatase
MKLLLVRHGIAETLEEAGGSDEARRLTDDGREKFQQSARGLAQVMDRPDRILTSPYARALETAQILADAWGGPEPRTARSLAWGTLAQLAGDLSKAGAVASADGFTVLVGHEPHMSGLLATLLGGRGAAGFAFKKGGAALIEISELAPGSGRVLFLLPPRLSRALAPD